MTEKELKKLNRYQLLELIILQTEQIAELEKQLEATRGQLESQQIQVAQAGSIAEAALQLSGIFETAQAAADSYLDNVKILSENAERLEEDARNQAQQILDQANAEADATLTGAREQADSTLTEAQEKANTILTEAQEKADSTLTEAQEKANSVLTEAQEKADSTLTEAQEKANTILTEAQEKADADIRNAQNMLEETTRKCEEKEAAIGSYIANVREAFHLQFQNLDQITKL